jgi:AmmeMemoRadiSam system protein A
VSLTNGEKLTLLKIARDAIRSALEGKSYARKTFTSVELNRRSGVFVTLRIGDELRGCIGYVEPIYPLAQATEEIAVKSALEDNRFMPLTKSEFNEITIEISVLSPLEELRDVEKIEIGKHGLVIDAGYRRGLLLPQVATEYGWDRKEFLKHTSLKAGLSPDAWKQKGIKLFTFSVDKFEESDFGIQPESMK